MLVIANVEIFARLRLAVGSSFNRYIFHFIPLVLVCLIVQTGYILQLKPCSHATQ